MRQWAALQPIAITGFRLAPLLQGACLGLSRNSMTAHTLAPGRRAW